MYNIIIFNINLYNCDCNYFVIVVILFIVCSVSFIVCVDLCAMFCLRVVFYYCDVCYVCVASYCIPLPPGKKPFAI
jgi:hypothetical protein